MDIVSILQQVDLFRGLSKEQLTRIERITHIDTFKMGTRVCQQGDVASEMYIVCQGQVEVAVRHNSGTDESMLYLGEGQIIGEMGLVDEGRRSATVIVVEDETLVVSIPNDAFNALCQENTAIGYLIMRNIAQDLSFKLRHHNSGVIG